jgi:hypothetical protein
MPALTSNLLWTASVPIESRESIDEGARMVDALACRIGRAQFAIPTHASAPR